MPRKTLRRAKTLEGVGVHTGASARITIVPAEPGEGVAFITDGTRIPAILENVSSADRRTDISSGGKTVMTTEHILSALAGMGIDDATVAVEGPEIPFFDGSALPIARAIAEAGTVEEPGEPDRLTLDKAMELRFGDTEFRICPSEGLEIICRITYDHPFIPAQEACFPITPEIYLKEIAPARTYIFREEAEEILARGLGKGGSLDCVLVINRDGYMNEPRFPDEPARHKLMDMVGDLALVGARLQMSIEATRPGHRTNHGLAAFIRKKGLRI
ncbi:MAG: UDP-3-O-acyl-N-acetylglucosamine deacetylase [candidate division WOR-3 bacterium]